VLAATTHSDGDRPRPIQWVDRKIGDPVWFQVFKDAERLTEMLESLDVVVRRSRGVSQGATVEFGLCRVSFAVYPQLVGYFSEKIGEYSSRKSMSAHRVMEKAQVLLRRVMRGTVV